MMIAREVVPSSVRMQRSPSLDEKTNPLERVGTGGVVGQRTLVVVGARGLEERSLATKGTITIGRDASANIQIDDRFVSKRHASLIVAEQIYLVDEGSSNGTFVNGDRVLPGATVRLADGDTVRLGADVSAEVLLPRQEPDPSSLTREARQNGQVGPA